MIITFKNLLPEEISKNVDRIMTASAFELFSPKDRAKLARQPQTFRNVDGVIKALAQELPAFLKFQLHWTDVENSFFDALYQIFLTRNFNINDKQALQDLYDKHIKKIAEKMPSKNSGFQNALIDRKIICNVFNIKKLHIIEVKENKNQVFLNHLLIDTNEERVVKIDDVNYQDPNIIHLVCFGDRFAPLFVGIPCLLYKITEKKLYRNKYGIDSITFKTYTNGTADLCIIPRTHLQTQVFNKLGNIQWKKYLDDGKDPKLEFFFKMNLRSELDHEGCEVIEQIFKEIFLRLKSLDVTEDIRNYFYMALKEYFQDFEQGFPGKPLEIKLKASAIQGTSPIAKQMYYAASHADSATILKLLQQGYSPDLEYKDVSILQAAIEGLFKQKNTENYLKIIRALVEYGANPNKETYGRTPEERIVDRVLFDKKNYLTYLELLLVLKRAKSAVPHIQPDVQRNYSDSVFDHSIGYRKVKEISHKMASWMDYLNKSMVVANLGSQITSSPAISLNSYPCLSFTVYDQKSSNRKLILVETKDISKLKPVEKQQMKAIFLKRFSKENITANEIKAHEKEFEEAIKSGINVYVDLVKMDDQLVAFNIAEIIFYGEHTIINHTRLAAAEAFFNYPRVMTGVSAPRGFALQKQNPDKTVVTIYEVAAFQTFLQIKDLEFFPKKDIPRLREIINAVRHHFYAEDFIDETEIKGAFYVKDPLVKKEVKKSSFFFDFSDQKWQEKNADWRNSNKNTIEFFKDFFERSEQSLIVAFFNNKTNLKLLSEQFDRYVNYDTTFEKIVNLYSEINDLSVSYTPRSSL